MLHWMALKVNCVEFVLEDIGRHGMDDGWMDGWVPVQKTGIGMIIALAAV